MLCSRYHLVVVCMSKVLGHRRRIGFGRLFSRELLTGLSDMIESNGLDGVTVQVRMDGDIHTPIVLELLARLMMMMIHNAARNVGEKSL